MFNFLFGKLVCVYDNTVYESVISLPWKFYSLKLFQIWFYRPQKKRNPTYSDEPLFGIRSFYHIVRINNIVINNIAVYSYTYTPVL